MGNRSPIDESRLFFVEGAPVGKGRPRFTRSGHAYTPKKTKDAEENIRATYQYFCGGYKFTGMVGIDITAYLPIPKQTQKSVWEWMEHRLEVFAPKKPDIDNIVKLVLDALNGVAYDDDKSVVEVMVSKRYDVNNPNGYTRIALYNVFNIGEDGEPEWTTM